MDAQYKTVFITGISRGLGAALAEQFLASGARVYGCSRHEPEALKDHPGLRFFPLDLADAEKGPGRLESALEDCGDLDLVVLNAGVLGEIRNCLDTPLADLRAIMEVNLWANQWILKAVFGRGRAVGQVVAVSSGAAVNAYAGWGGYNISKAALNMFIGVLAAEHPETHFTALAPGLVDTAMQDYLTSLPDEERYAAVKRLKEAKAAGKMPTPAAAAGEIIRILPELRSGKSGCFADLRDFQAG